MPGRTFVLGAGLGYRYGYNGKEKDPTEFGSFHDNSGFIESLRWGTANYSDYEAQFPNLGDYQKRERSDKKSFITFDVEGGITYGHLAASVGIKKGTKTKNFGFNVLGGGYALGGSYNSSTGGKNLSLDGSNPEFALSAEGGVGLFSFTVAKPYSPAKGTFGEGQISGGLSIPGLDANMRLPGSSDALSFAPNVTNAGVGSSEKSIFLGFEGALALGLGVKGKVGISINLQPAQQKFSAFELQEKKALESKPRGTKTNPTN